MAKQNDALKDRLSRYRELNISVTGQKVRTHYFKPCLVRFG